MMRESQDNGDGAGRVARVIREARGSAGRLLRVFFPRITWLRMSFLSVVIGFPLGPVEMKANRDFGFVAVVPWPDGGMGPGE